MPVLIIDTALSACTAVVAEGARVLAVRTEPMARGHQERLAGFVADVMAEAAVDFGALQRIGVVTGPGSFTGLRVGLAFARGLEAALGRPLTGLSALAALAEDAADGEVVNVAAAIDARRGQLYLQAFDGGAPAGPPAAVEASDGADYLRGLSAPPAVLVGSGAILLADAFPAARIVDRAAASPEALVRLMDRTGDVPAEPLYLRAPDARPPAGARAP